MQGYQVSFFTQQDKRHQGKPIVEWLVQLAQELHLSGVTVLPASLGIGHHHQLHAAHFFELSDQPVVVIMVLTATEAEQLLARLQAEKVSLFYVKTPAEFALLGKDDARTN